MPTQTSSTEEIWQAHFCQLMDALQNRSTQPAPAIGESAKTCIYQENTLRLYQYQAQQGVKQKKPPILIVYALVNRPDIVDLEPQRSLVLRLLEQGYPVFLVDWGYPDSTDSQTSLDDYINGYLYRCVQQVRRQADVKKIDLLGICQGGVFSMCYSALYPADVRKLVTLVTPVDFHTAENLLSKWTNDVKLKQLFSSAGNIPAQTLSQLFRSLKPYLLNREKYRLLDNILKSPEQLETFLRMEKWLNNGPDLAGTAAIEFAEKFYQSNGFMMGELLIGEKAVHLSSICCPVLNLYATKDHIVPPSSSKALSKCVSKKLYTEKPLEGGHIGAFTSLKTQGTLIQVLNNWLNKK
jgi:polyhydroxyalkanoate synthase